MARKTTKKAPSRTFASRLLRSAKQAGKPSKRSLAEEQLLAELAKQNLHHGLEREFQFHPPRKWRVDFAWRAHRVVVEVEGGVFIRGRHTSPAGFIADTEKYNRLALDGYTLLRLVPRKGWVEEAIPLIVEALSQS